MKLLTAVDQITTRTGDHGFELHVKVEFSSEERSLIQRYHAERWALLAQESCVYAPHAESTTVITIRTLIKGATFTCQNVAEIIIYEQTIKEAFTDLEDVVDLIRRFKNEILGESTPNRNL